MHCYGWKVKNKMICALFNFIFFKSRIHSYIFLQIVKLKNCSLYYAPFPITSKLTSAFKGSYFWCLYLSNLEIYVAEEATLSSPQNNDSVCLTDKHNLDLWP